MKKFLIAVLFVFAVGTAGVLLAFGQSAPSKGDTVSVNDAVMSAMQMDTETESIRFLTDQLGQIFEDMDAARNNRDKALQLFLFLIIAAVALSGAFLYFYCERGILKPFRKLQGFARHIAAGDLDIPLEMDRNNLFGAFTESFDLMRDELHKAKENERKADRSKKELVASLSHDIKTPVASIKAVTELMILTADDDKRIKQLETINAKAEQINALITDMFHATLEELQALSVTAAEIESAAIPDLIKNADYENRVEPFSVPNCIVTADLLRLQQVFDNIIGNSYKYAGTKIEINSKIDGQYLLVDITDFGKGVAEDELPLIFNKFYRGKDAGAKSGYGLGLYISKYLLEQMSGDLKCENRPAGFAVKLTLRLAG
ncbi:MAG: HAMP domain-containing histidine kinase [Oscillospiraceae bacterium]|nr:HAMP domain-containing histidine kinase [Oscillospiraceae bacterium]